jgi:hypothetical protein
MKKLIAIACHALLFCAGCACFLYLLLMLKMLVKFLIAA